MCAGKDELKPHLHYPSNCRSLASKISEIAGLDQADVLMVAVTVGLNGIIHQLSGEVNPPMLERDRRAKWREIVMQSERETMNLSRLIDALLDAGTENLVNADKPPF